MRTTLCPLTISIGFLLACGGLGGGGSPGAVSGTSETVSMPSYDALDWSIWEMQGGTVVTFHPDGTLAKDRGTTREGTWTRSGDTLSITTGDTTNPGRLLGPCAMGWGATRGSRVWPKCRRPGSPYAGVEYATFSDGTYSYTFEPEHFARLSWTDNGTWSDEGDTIEVQVNDKTKALQRLDSCHVIEHYEDKGSVWWGRRTFPDCAPEEMTWSDLDWTVWEYSRTGDDVELHGNGTAKRYYGSNRTGTWTATGRGFDVDWGDKQETFSLVGRCSFLRTGDDDTVVRGSRKFPECAER